MSPRIFKIFISPRVIAGERSERSAFQCFRSCKGFTLLEVLLAVTLFSIVISSSYGIFSMGTMIWRRSQGRSVVERKATFALEALARDLRMSVRVQDKKDAVQDKKEGKGKGNSREIFIPSLISVKSEKVDMIQSGFVHYLWDSSKRQLCRSEMTGLGLDAVTESPCRAIAASVDSFKLRYLIYEGLGESYSWYDEWEVKEEAPIAVEVTLKLVSQLKGERSPTTKIFKRTLSVPVGGLIKDQDDAKVITTTTTGAAGG